MASKPFFVYRFYHPTGGAKDWAFTEVGNGQAEIRWGPANHLYRLQHRPRSEAEHRAEQKMRKGYHYLGVIRLDEQGHRLPPEGEPPSPPESAPVPPQPLDLKALLGAGPSFYF